MISVVVFSYSETLESMLVEYAATEMGSLDNYFDASPKGKSIRGNGIATFLLHVAQCIFFNKKDRVKTTLIADALLKSFYSRLGFKVIKYFATSPNFEEARKQFHYGSGKSKAYKKKTIGLQCLQTIPRHVTFLHDNRTNLNTHKNVLINLYVDLTSENWFPSKYIEAEIKKKCYKTIGQLASDEMENEIRNYIYSLNHDPQWVRRTTNDINKLLVNRGAVITVILHPTKINH